MLKVNEIFSSLQGEGLYIGHPATFIRLTGCNLKCIWCDTEKAFKEGKLMSTKGIVECVKEFPNTMVVLTGGEPLMQNIEKLIMMLSADYYIHVETNGTLFRNLPLIDHWVISPKLISSGMSNKLNVNILGQLKKYSDVEWKFVIKDLKDFDMAIGLINELDLKPAVFQPLNNDMKRLSFIAKQLRDAKITNIRVLPQLHKLLKMR